MTCPLASAPLAPYLPEHLERWTSDDPACGGSSNYAGADLSEFFLAPISINRDTADSVTLSNWRVIGSELDGLAQHPESGEHRFGHWACGWYELWLIHESDSEALKCADTWAAALSDYPVASESDLEAIELEAEAEAWERWGAEDWRRQLALRFEALYGDTLPDDAPYSWGDDQAEALSDDALYAIWCIASNRLGCPVEHRSDGVSFDFERGAEALSADDLAPYIVELEP